MLMGLMPILSKSYYESVAFDETTLEPPLGSGPYRIESVDPGRGIVYRRDPDWWGRDLAVNRGQYNFDRIRYDYYRDADVMMEAFKAGDYDFRNEPSAARLATGYDFPAVVEGRVRVESLPTGDPPACTPWSSTAAGRSSRTARFATPSPTRSTSSGSTRPCCTAPTSAPGASSTTPSSVRAGFRRAASWPCWSPSGTGSPPSSSSAPTSPPGKGGSLRANLRKARRLLAGAGWTVRDGELRRESDGLPMAFEILLVRPGNEKIALEFARNLERLGVEARVRTVDTAQYQNRRNAYDFDMLIYRWGMSLSPGNEQAFYWGSSAADEEGTRNYPGVRDPVVDSLIKRMTNVRAREDFVDTIRAMDRVLLWGHYFVPLYHRNDDHVAWWDKFDRPEVTPLYGTVVEAWWEDSAKAAASPALGRPAGRGFAG